MTYSIIPPILVVLSVIGILLFLMKKAPKVAALRQEKDPGLKVFGEKKPEEMKKGLFSKDRFLVVLEKMTRRSKIAFIKLENKFASWNESIKRRRKQTDNASGEVSITEERAEERSVTREKIPSIPVRNYDNPNERKVEGAERKKVFFSREKKVKPMVSEKMTTPPKRAELKNRLEKILIERIAANPKDIEAYERLGEYYFEIGNMEYSKDCFKQVIRLDSGNVNARSKMRRLESLLRR